MYCKKDYRTALAIQSMNTILLRIRGGLMLIRVHGTRRSGKRERTHDYKEWGKTQLWLYLSLGREWAHGQRWEGSNAVERTRADLPQTHLSPSLTEDLTSVYVASLHITKRYQCLRARPLRVQQENAGWGTQELSAWPRLSASPAVPVPG